jgi:hypothetical protein
LITSHVPTRNGDVDGAALDWVGKEFVKVRRRDVTHDRARPAGQRRCHLVRVAVDHRADDINAAVESAELAPPHPPLHLPVRDPRGQELLPRHRAVLAPGDVRHHAANCIVSTHTVD